MQGQWDDFDTLLGSAIIVWTLVAGFVISIFLQALATLFTGVFFRDKNSQKAANNARGVVGNGIDLCGTLVGTVLQLFVQGISVCIGIFSYFALLLLFAGALHVVYLYFPIVLGSFTAGWNDSVGLFWSRYVIGVLEIIQIVFEKVVGLYNLLIFTFLKTPIELLIHMMTNGVPDLILMGNEIGASGNAIYNAFGQFQAASRADCKMQPSQLRAMNTSCMRPDLRDMDLVSALRPLNKAFAHLINFFPRTCFILQQPVTVLFFPLMDIELSIAIHHLVNAIQHTVFQVTALSVKRWEMSDHSEIAGGRVAINMPDLGPIFDHVASMFIHLGKMIDNWMDVAIYLVLTLADPSKALDCDMQKGEWEFPATGISSASFSRNHTVLTQLTSQMFSLTDGYNIEYHHHGKNANARIKVDAWPIPINITYGVAAIAYARDLSRDETTSGHTTALFGCSCTDQADENGVQLGIAIFCAIVPYESFDGLKQSAFVVNMTWEVENTPKLMVCRDTKIAVESIRYQAQRITSPNEFQFFNGPNTQRLTCVTKGTCTRIDAAIWVMPVCPLGTRVNGGSTAGNTACLRALKDFSCFPFCLGVHRTFAANERIIIRSSSAWERNMLLTSRDCTLQASETFDAASSQILERVESDNAGTWVPRTRIEEMQTVQIKSANTDGNCRVQEDAISSVPLLQSELFDSAMMFQEAHLQAEPGWEHAQDNIGDLYRFAPTDAMLLEKQPFAFAGDMAMRTMTTCRNGQLWQEGLERECTTVVDVMQLTGSEYNQFTLRHIVPAGIPVTRRPNTISTTDEVLSPGRITLPPVIVRSVYLHNPAATTYDAFWYTVNPDYEMLHCLLRYCNGFEELVNCMQFSVLSNYENIRVWKIIPQAGCVRDPESGRADCPPQTAQSLIFDDEFNMPIGTSKNFDYTGFCADNQLRNLYVEDMEEFDAINMAVTVRRGNVQALYDELWGGGGKRTHAPVSATVYYFIHTQTLEMREGFPWVEPITTGVDGGFLCSDMRFGPALGSAWGEVNAAVTFGLKTITTTLMNVPGLVWLFEKPEERCARAALAMHHSFFEDCGSKYIDFTDAFDALNRANVHAWSILDFVAQVLGWAVDNEFAVDSLSMYLRGEQMYKENKMVLAKSALTSSATDVFNLNKQRFVSVQDRAGGGGTSVAVILSIGSPEFMSGMSVTVSPLAYAEYFARLLARIIDKTIVIAQSRVGKNGATTFRYVVGNATMLWYESVYTDWDELISTRARRMCTGIAMMNGYTNPWARFLLHWCLAGVEWTDGIMHALAAFMVEIPMVVCVCVTSVGHEFRPYVQEKCVPETATTLRPFLASMVAWDGDIEMQGRGNQQSLMQTVCLQTMDAFETSVHDVFADWAIEHTEAGTATISLFDFLGVLMQRESAQCSNFDTNPFVSVIVPSPLDYFRACGDTAICKARCKDYYNLLQDGLQKRNGQGTLPNIQFRTSMESAMFGQFRIGDFEDSYMRLAAMSELPKSHDACGKCDREGDDCVAVVGLENADRSLYASRFTVRSFCVPLGMNHKVFSGTTWYIEDDATQGALGGVSIAGALDADNNVHKILRVVFSLPHGDHVIMLSQVRNLAIDSTLYVGFLQQITVWRSNTLLHFASIGNSMSIMEACSAAIEDGLDPSLFSLPADFVSGEYGMHLIDVKIVDFLNVPSSEYTVDLILQLEINGKAVQHTRSVDIVSPVYIRLGWCEKIPSNFHGVHREEPSMCAGITQSQFRCHALNQSSMQDLFADWLQTGVILHLPWRPQGTVQNVWVPSQRVSPTRTRHASMYGVNISLVDGTIEVLDQGAPEFLVSGGANTRKALPNRPYIDGMDFEGINPGSYDGIRASLSAHQNEDPSQYEVFDTTQPGVGLWYASASPIVARSWLREVRHNPRLYTLDMLASRQRAMNVEVQRYCNGYSCHGCDTLQLRQTCAALQTCITRQCIGTTVNNGDILCSLGLVLESLYSEMVGLYISGWHAIASLLIAVLRQSVESVADIPYTFRISLVSDLAHTIVCETKDVLAVFTNVFATLLQVSMSSGDGIQRSDTVSYGLQHANQVNSDAYAQNSIQASAFHQFLYQISLIFLYVPMGVYRWGFCTVSNVLNTVSTEVTFVSLGSMNTTENGATWGACTTEVAVAQILSATRSAEFFEGMAQVIQDSFEGRDEMDDSVEQAQDAAVQAGASFFKRVKPHKTMKPIDLILHLFDAVVAWFSGVLTGAQDIIYNFDQAKCRVPDIALEDAVQCACGDEPAYVIPEHRTGGIAEGALWCAGTLYMASESGKYKYVYNPYSLHELGILLHDMDTYLECISTVTKGRCVQPSIPVFDIQDINPMAVLTRCRSNYMQQQWDIGAHALFDEDYIIRVDYTQLPPTTAREAALKWAKDVDSELLSCVVGAAKIPEEFGRCLSVFLRLHVTDLGTRGSRTETFFAYKMGHENEHPATNPDSCSLYTGPASSAESNFTRVQFRSCLEGESADPANCNLPAMAWTGNLYSRVPVGVVHREAILEPAKRMEIARQMHETARARIEAALNAFDRASLDAIDTIFFSAEGDALHQMIDCMFLGPHSRIDYLIADKEGTLPTLSWFRDANDGTTRDFDLPCEGTKLNGDEQGPPFTCGSAARRAIIKQYVRGEFLNDVGASNITAGLILEVIDNITRDWLNVDNYGCPNPVNPAEMGIEYCGSPERGGNRFRATLSTFWEVKAQNVVGAVTKHLPDYYRRVMTDTSKWKNHFLDTVHTQMWGDWKDSNVAADLQLFAPHEPIISYDKSECMDSTTGNELKNSMWGVCAAMVSQPMLTIPLSQPDGATVTDDDEASETWMPQFMRDLPFGHFDPMKATLLDEDAVENWMNGLLQEAWVESPLYAHYVMRYVPSMSSVCKGSKTNDLDALEHSDYTENKIQFSSLYMQYRTTNDENFDEEVYSLSDVTIPFVSFGARTLGAVSRTCPCSRIQSTIDSSGIVDVACIFAQETCDVLLENVAALQLNYTMLTEIICSNNDRRFTMNDIANIQHEIMFIGNTVACPEMQMTDQWGFFPYDYDVIANNEAWVAEANVLQELHAQFLYDGADLYAFYKGGIGPANLEYVVQSIRNASNGSPDHGKRKKPLQNGFGGSVAQDICMDADGIFIGDEEFTTLTNDFVHTLFPVAQLVNEPSGLSTCTRYLLEYVKYLFVKNILKVTALGEYELSMERWKERCGIKVKQAKVCNNLGILNVIPAREEWKAIRTPACTFPLDEFALDAVYGPLRYYVTPGCMFYGDGEWYNLRRCRSLNDSLPFGPSQLVSACHVQSLSALNIENGDAKEETHPFFFSALDGHGVLHWGDGSQFRHSATYIQDLYKTVSQHRDNVANTRLGVGLSTVFIHALFNNVMDDVRQQYSIVFGNTDPVECPGGLLQGCSKAEFCDKVFDWWPEETEDAPYGYHPTATCRADDHAYRTFDSYISMDRDSMNMVFENQALRHAPLMYQYSGTTGLCRLHSINMPLFETNTNRVCSESPMTMPNPVLPFDRDANRRNTFAGGQCAASSSDVPWDASHSDLPPWFGVVGNIAGLLRMTSPKTSGAPGRVVISDKYPPSLMTQKELVTLLIGEVGAPTVSRRIAPLLPKAGLYMPTGIAAQTDPWNGCVPPLEVVSCKVRDSESCPMHMSCTQTPDLPQDYGICLPLSDTINEGVTAQPCYRSDMCPETDHCLAKGYCGKVKMHLWNTGTQAIEFTSLVQDTCGSETSSDFPFTQTFEGASPWETIPDLLQGHGMCAARHQYAYKYAMNNTVEGKKPGDPRAYLRKRDGDETVRRFVWPWVQQGPSGMLLDEGRETSDARDTGFMHMYPHVCDRNYMHQPNQKVCSGISGDQTLAMKTYKLQIRPVNATSNARGWFAGENLLVQLTHSYWMRSTDPFDKDRVTVGAMFDTEDYHERGAFAFLGGDKRASSSEYAGSVGVSETKFVHCSTLQPCGVPIFTFNGIANNRGAFTGAGGTWKWFGAEDYASCGSIGFIREGSNGQECTFDIALFPLIRLLVSGSSIFCTDVFGVAVGNFDNREDQTTLIPTVDVVLDLGTLCAVGKLCCLGNVEEDDVECKYRAIGLDDSASSDGKMHFQTYELMVAKLNEIHIFGTAGGFLDKIHTLQGLAVVTECIEDMVRVNKKTQFSMAASKYNAKIGAISGLYQILRFHLYEVPWLWYYKWAYKNVIANTLTMERTIAESITSWKAIVSIGESWSSRTNIESTSVRRCNNLQCKCGTDANLRNALLCLNAGVRLRIPVNDTDGSGTVLQLDSDVKMEYFSILRQAIRQKVMAFVKERFGMDVANPLTFVPGCHHEATWKITRCREEEECMMFLVRNATKKTQSTPKDYDASEPFYYDYFEYGNFTESTSTCVNMLEVVEELVNSYQFTDDDFEPLDSTLRAYHENGKDTPWKVPLFKLLREPVFGEIDPIKLETKRCNTGTGWFVVDHQTTNLPKECIFQEAYNHMESAGDPDVSDRPIVFFTGEDSAADIARMSDRLELDICAEDSALRKTYTNGKVSMSCTFSDSKDEHGRDQCDLHEDGYERECFYIPGNFETSGEDWEIQNRRNIMYDIGLSRRNNEWMFEGERVRFPFLICLERDRKQDVTTPMMKCSESPIFNERCRKKNNAWTVAIPGLNNTGTYYGTWVAMHASYQNNGQGVYDGGAPWPMNTWAKKTIPPNTDEEDGTSEFQVLTFPEGTTVAKQTSLGNVFAGVVGLPSFPPDWDVIKWRTQYRPFRFKDHCPAHILESGSGVTAENEAESTIPQFHSMHSMCHRLDSEDKCFPFESERVAEFFDDAAGEDISPCTIRRVRLPPGVAGRFFTSTTPRAEWNYDENNPVWTKCPHDHNAEDVFLKGLKIVPERKAMSTWYHNQKEEWDMTGCTRQDGILCQGDTDASDEREGDAGCYVVSADSTAEWRLSRSPRCRDLGGICSWSLTLADGYFCGTGTATNNNREVLPPPKTCAAPDDHKFLVRGRETEDRSLWKCAQCVKYSPLQYVGEMRCGFKNQENPIETFTPSDVVQSVKEYIAENVHSIDKLRELHESREFEDLMYANDENQPFFPSDGDVAYINLVKLGFTDQFADWNNAAEEECQTGVASLTGSSNAAQHEQDSNAHTDMCSWDGTYDVTVLQERDDSYLGEIDTLQCATDVPELYEYEHCSSIGNDPRVMLRNFTELYYRKQQGTWMPVLNGGDGVEWELDKSAVLNAFTVMYASTARPLQQTYAKYILSDSLCRQNNVLSGMCAKITNASTNLVYVRHLNPWIGGEFNPDLVDRTLEGVMGLDQCRRKSGLWEGCCSCFPHPMCCQPEKAICEDGESPPNNPIFANNYFGGEKYRQECNAHDFEYPKSQPISHTDPTNICLHDMFAKIPDYCTHNQGVLGGGSGVPLQGVGDLYEHTFTESPTRVERFLNFYDGVTVWAGAATHGDARYVSGQYTRVQMPANLLYPEHIVLQNSNAAGLLVHAMHMESGKSGMQNEAVIPVRQWVPSVHREWARDYETIARLYPSLAQSADQEEPLPTWDCPFRTASFWGKHTPGFNPLLPDPIRAELMFSGKFYCQDENNQTDPFTDGGCIHGVHPFHGVHEYNGIRDYSTIDGACFYDAALPLDAPDSDQSVPTANAAHVCGLKKQLENSLHGHWYRSEVMSPAHLDCSETLDWPSQPMQFRSGQEDIRNGTKNIDPQRCRALPRVSAFRMKIKSDAPLQPHPVKTTMHAGGDCHMGRATRTNAEERAAMREYEHCVTVARTSTQAHIRCTAPKLGTTRVTAADRIFILEREQKMRPLEDVVLGPPGEVPVKCDMCDAHKVKTKGPGGSILEQAETSVGTIQRISTTKALADEMRRLCGKQQNCQIEAEKWAEDTVLENMLLHPHSLLQDTDAIAEEELFGDHVSELSNLGNIDDADLWSVPWVLCNNGTCKGSITKEKWKQDRYGQCWGVLGGVVANDDTETFARSIRICTVTGALETLCTELLNALADIENANCIGSTNECEVLSTFYTPAQYFTSNKAFARETIRDFYLSQADDACFGEDDRLQKARSENALVQKNCAASTIEIIKESLQFARLAARMLLSVVTSVYTIATDFVMIVFYVGMQEDITPLLRDIMHHITQIIRVFESAISQMMDLLLYLVSTFGKVGQVLAQVMSFMCKAVSVFWYVMVEFLYCQLLKAKIVAVVGFFSEVFDLISKAADVVPGFSFVSDAVNFWLDNVHTPVHQAIAEIPCGGNSIITVKENAIQFDGNGRIRVKENPIKFDISSVIARAEESCHIPTINEDAFVQEKAYIATRCWASPGLGNLLSDTNSLGCTAADTCILDGVGDGEGVCESCPSVLDVGSFARFGCDLTLNKCKCNVPILSRTPCIRNADCFDSVPCRLMTNIESTTYGNVDCMQSCPNEPLCLIESEQGGSTGECVCLTEQPRTQSCEKAGALVVMPIEEGACLMARDPVMARTIAMFSTTITQLTHLTIAPCALSKARVCHNVQNRNGAIQTVVVGTDLLTIPQRISGQRRLLWDIEHIDNTPAWIGLLPEMAENVTLDWSRTGICSELIHPNMTLVLGPTDKMLQQECLKWRAVLHTAKLMFSLNVSNEHLLLTWDGALEFAMQENVLYDVMAQPHSYLEAVFYAGMQFESASTVMKALRKSLSIGGQFWSFYIQPWLKRYKEKTLQHYRNQTTATDFVKKTAGNVQTEASHLWNNSTTWHSAEMVVTRIMEEYMPDMMPATQPEANMPTCSSKGSCQNESIVGPHRKLQQALPGVFAIGWPVKWNNSVWEDQNTPVCELFDIGYGSILEMWTQTINYYDKGYGNRSNLSYHVLDTLMHIPPVSEVRKLERRKFVRDNQEGIAQFSVLGGLLDATINAFTAVFAVDEDDIISFFDPGVPLETQVADDLFTLQRILHDVSRCNLQRIMLCDTKPRALVPTVLICFLLTWALTKVLWFLPDGFMTLVVISFFPGMVMWYAYGFSPTCTPMIPTCLMQDIVETMRTAFPSNVQWPALLIKQDICSRDGVPLVPEQRGNVSCFKSCASDDFQFVSWEDPFAWFVCELDKNACRKAAQWVSNQTSLFQRFNKTTAYFVSVLEFDNYHLTEAHRMCGILTGFYVVPALLVALFFIMMLGTFISSLVVLGFKSIAFTVMARTEDDDEDDDEDGYASGDEDTSRSQGDLNENE